MKRSRGGYVRRLKDIKPYAHRDAPTLDESGVALMSKNLWTFVQRSWHIVEPVRAFRTGWALEAVCDHLEAISRGHITKLLINVPPGCMKSMAVDVFWPAWEWGPFNKPSMRHLAFSYSPTLTIRDNGKCRDIIKSSWYRERWGDAFRIRPDIDGKEKFQNDATGWCMATSIGGVGTGERGDRTKLDDPHNVKDVESDVKRGETVRWVREGFMSRTNDLATGAFVVIAQRTNRDDTSGMILENEFGFTKLILPMHYDSERHCKTILLPFKEEVWEDPRKKDGELLFPELFPKKEVELLARTLGEYATAAQLEQLPAPRSGGMFKRDKFTIVEPSKVPWDGLILVRGWDLAATRAKKRVVALSQAATAGVLLGIGRDGDIYICDVRQFFEDSGTVERVITSVATQDGEDVWISIPQDPGQAGKSQARAFIAALAGHKVECTPETGSKETRAEPLAAQVEAGRVYIVRGEWNRKYIDEMGLFPNGRKDQVDATTRAYDRALRVKKQHRGVSNMGMPLSVDVHGGVGGNPAIGGIDAEGRTHSATHSHRPENSPSLGMGMPLIG